MPAAPSASISRWMVRSDTSNRRASSRDVTRWCTCSSSMIESRRSARIHDPLVLSFCASFYQIYMTEDDRYDGVYFGGSHGFLPLSIFFRPQGEKRSTI